MQKQLHGSVTQMTPMGIPQMTDAEKLRALADWFDIHDKRTGNSNGEVQADLRRIANRI